MLALGGQQKNTIALATENQIIIGPHLGDLDSILARKSFQQSIKDLCHFYCPAPELIIHDDHPDYYSSNYAENFKLPTLSVQHHEAHLRSCVLEHGLSEPVFGVAWDGTGAGPDGTIWGGEFFVLESGICKRVGHLRTFPLPGGEKAIRDPVRTVLGLFYEMRGKDYNANDDFPFALFFSDQEYKILTQCLQQKINSPITSSIGRLFDGIATILSLCQKIDFEGQAAMQLEFCATDYLQKFPEASDNPYSFTVNAQGVIDWQFMISAIVADLKNNLVREQIAWRVHTTLIKMIHTLVERFTIKTVVLTGGCFQNYLLLSKSIESLRQKGYNVYWPQKVPINDGGLSLGQLGCGYNFLFQPSKQNDHQAMNK